MFQLLGRRMRHWLMLTGLLCLGHAPAHASAEAEFLNPILPGGYPDPSIVRVGEDFYLVNSSFEYFPGLPIHHSRDLVNWELVGHGLHRPEQASTVVNLLDVQSDGGIHAPTLRWHDGLFYLITTNVHQPREPSRPTEFVNFVLTAKDVRGPWSDPHVLAGAPGIDPDIFFDDDGKVWYVGTHSPDKPRFPGEGEIWLQQIDTDAWRLIGERHLLWRGACGGVWVEGPHLYRRDGRYYLLVAEGGTGFDHAVMVAVSDQITGPYQSNPRNPILSSRHLSYDHWVNSTGHADLLELADGRWYLVALGIRGDLERRSNMGRESFLVPVSWEREPYPWKEIKHEWPVPAPKTGRVERHTALPFADQSQRRKLSFSDNFDADTLDLQWNFRRVPLPGSYSLAVRRGWLRLYARPETIGERSRASLLGIKQTETRFDYAARMQFKAGRQGAEAGISLFQKDDHYLNYTVVGEPGGTILRVLLAEPGEAPRELARTSLANDDGELQLRVRADHSAYHFEYSQDRGQHYQALGHTAANHLLSRGYTGAHLGLYATGNGKPSRLHADFDWISYRGYSGN